MPTIPQVIPIKLGDLDFKPKFSTSIFVSPVPKGLKVPSKLELGTQGGDLAIFIALGVIIIILILILIWTSRKGIGRALQRLHGLVRDRFPIFCSRQIIAGLVWDSAADLASYTGYQTRPGDMATRSTFYVGTPEPLPEDIPRTIEEQIEIDSKPKSTVVLGRLNSEEVDTVQADLAVLGLMARNERDILDSVVADADFIFEIEDCKI